ncbi:hypothetical protein [uncultured Ruegeria sp.]|nr:hypothetical protein [uncultured Ruegeria sp.]
MKRVPTGTSTPWILMAAMTPVLLPAAQVEQNAKALFGAAYRMSRFETGV